MKKIEKIGKIFKKKINIKIGKIRTFQKLIKVNEKME
jgi:hypothetical protein